MLSRKLEDLSPGLQILRLSPPIGESLQVSEMWETRLQSDYLFFNCYYFWDFAFTSCLQMKRKSDTLVCIKNSSSNNHGMNVADSKHGSWSPLGTILILQLKCNMWATTDLNKWRSIAVHPRALCSFFYFFFLTVYILLGRKLVAMTTLSIMTAVK